eukprot:RCo047022
MEPSQQALSNMERMRAAAQRNKHRPLDGVVSATKDSDAKPRGLGSSSPTPPMGLPPKPSSALSSSMSSSISSTGPRLGITPGVISPDRRGDTEAQEVLRRKLERVGIAPQVDAPGEFSRKQSDGGKGDPSAKLDLSDTRSFLGGPPPKVGMIQCYINRDKAAGLYHLYLEEKNLFLMASIKRKQNKTSNYLISLDPDDLNRDSGHYYGKLRANFVGTEFIIFDKGEKPSRMGGSSAGLGARQEVGAVLYDRNILGTKGPRKMTVLLPAVDEAGKRAVFRPSTEEETLISHFRRGTSKDMLILKNKEPSWNEQLKAFVLNFNGRVTMASVKNFQLVDQDNTSKVLLQFGKIDESKFTLDFQYPISGLQAFGIALSAFDSKLACE